MDYRLITQLKVRHINAHSLDAHFDDVRTIILQRGLHLFAISESWLKKHMHAGSFEIIGYTLLRHERIDRNCGGVALYVRNGLRCRCVASSERPIVYRYKPGFLFVLVEVESSSVLVCVVYSPSKAGFGSDVEEALLNCRVTYDYIILCGDLNIDLPVPSTPRNILLDFFATFSISPLPFEPTHHPGGPHTTIDYICTGGMQATDTSQVHYPSISKHDALFATFPIEVPAHVETTFTCRDFRRLDFRPCCDRLGPCHQPGERGLQSRGVHIIDGRIIR
ncbi:hypothetical protein TKK_0002974 [Trichogramma kaykai]